MEFLVKSYTEGTFVVSITAATIKRNFIVRGVLLLTSKYFARLLANIWLRNDTVYYILSGTSIPKSRIAVRIVRPTASESATRKRTRTGSASESTGID